MISMLAGLLLQASATAAAPPAPPSPPPPASRRGTPPRAKVNIGSLLSNDDYPPQALRNEEEGVVGFRLDIAVDGKVTGCTVTSSSGSALLDSTTCRLITDRAEFEPARNRRGKPVPDSVVARIVWRIGAPDLIPLAGILNVVTVRAFPSGQSTCFLVVNGAPPRVTDCPNSPSLSEMIAMAVKHDEEVERTVLTSFTPEGVAERSDRQDHGAPTMMIELALDVASNGMVTACRVVRNETLGPAAGRPPEADPCGKFPLNSPMFEPSTQAAETRRMNFRVREYVRLPGQSELPVA